VTAGGLHYTWPDVRADQPDSIAAYGQTIPVSAVAGTTSIGFLGSSSGAALTGAPGTVTVTYTDGSTSTATLGLGDYALADGLGLPYPGNLTVAKMPYRNAEDGLSDAVSVYVFAQTIPVNPAKTVASITLPGPGGSGSLGIFAISAG
jgi:hypothetical protein